MKFQVLLETISATRVSLQAELWKQKGERTHAGPAAFLTFNSANVWAWLALEGYLPSPHPQSAFSLPITRSGLEEEGLAQTTETEGNSPQIEQGGETAKEDKRTEKIEGSENTGDSSGLSDPVELGLEVTLGSDKLGVLQIIRGGSLAACSANLGPQLLTFLSDHPPEDDHDPTDEESDMNERDRLLSRLPELNFAFNLHSPTPSVRPAHKPDIIVLPYLIQAQYISDPAQYDAPFDIFQPCEVVHEASEAEEQKESKGQNDDSSGAERSSDPSDPEAGQPVGSVVIPPRMSIWNQGRANPMTRQEGRSSRLDFSVTISTQSLALHETASLTISLTNRLKVSLGLLEIYVAIPGGVELAPDTSLDGLVNECAFTSGRINEYGEISLLIDVFKAKSSAELNIPIVGSCKGMFTARAGYVAQVVENQTEVIHSRPLRLRVL